MLEIYQIYYDDITYFNLDKEFIPLDNRNNPYPDWYEYYPISNFFNINKINKNKYYGFFSPKLFSKTSIKANEIKNYIINDNFSSDVYLISPFYDEMSLHLNIFDHGEFSHPGFKEYLSNISLEFGILKDFNKQIHTDKSFVFCNYFVAKGDFWIKWLNISEMIFKLVQKNDNLKIKSIHYNSPNYMHPFLIERVASYLLFNDNFKVDNFFSILILNRSRIFNKNKLLLLNDLKNKILYQNLKKDNFFQEKFNFLLNKHFYFDFFHEHY